MIAVDTNILVYAHRDDSSWHQAADECLTQLAESVAPWAIPWPCLHEFLAIVTHPRIYKPPTPLHDALIQVDCWLESPSLFLIGETADHWTIARSVMETSRIAGPLVHDARIVAVCVEHGVRVLWSADRDFSRFGDLKVENPLTRVG